MLFAPQLYFLVTVLNRWWGKPITANFLQYTHIVVSVHQRYAESTRLQIATSSKALVCMIRAPHRFSLLSRTNTTLCNMHILNHDTKAPLSFLNHHTRVSLPLTDILPTASCVSNFVYCPRAFPHQLAPSLINSRLTHMALGRKPPEPQILRAATPLHCDRFSPRPAALQTVLCAWFAPLPRSAARASDRATSPALSTP